MDKDTRNRLYKEYDELKEKCEKLQNFIADEFKEGSAFAALDYIERSDLRRQSRAMHSYLEVLGRRVQRQKEKEKSNG